MRAKFRCNSVKYYGDTDDANTPREYELSAVYDSRTEENRRFAKATPSGNLAIRVDNPHAGLEVGEEYYLDFTPTALAQHQKTPETMGNTHDTDTYTRMPEPDRYGSPAAAYQPQHAGYTTTVNTPGPATETADETSRGYTESAPATPEASEH